jgi:hypothetical protein
MRKNPERLAWIVLLISFSVFIGLIVFIPLGIRSFILFSQEGQNVTLEVQRGPLRVTWAGRGEPIAIADKRRDDIPERTIVTTDLTEGRLVMYASEEKASVVSSVQLYNNTKVILSSARSPRFAVSQLPHCVVVEVMTGRVRINVSDTEERATNVEVKTPYSTILFVEGSYEVKVNSETEVTVRHGQATISTGQQELTLNPAQRAIINEREISEPLPAIRNLVINGDFQDLVDDWAVEWLRYSIQDYPEQPLGSISIVANEGRRVVNFYRNATNHGEVGIRQEINYDVRDFTSLELHLSVRVISEDIAGFGGCGYLSSECPIIVRVEYENVYNIEGSWQHGFYIGQPKSDWLIHDWAQLVQEGTWQTYDSGNLMEELAEAQPALIKSVVIYASGHSFHAMVTEVELLAQE